MDLLQLETIVWEEIQQKEDVQMSNESPFLSQLTEFSLFFMRGRAC